MASAPNIFIDFLTALNVPHTDGYSTARFGSMSFNSLFGYSKLLAEYGVDSQGYELTDINEIRLLTPPYMARTKKGRFIIVLDIKGDTVTYQSEGSKLQTSVGTLMSACDGTVFLAFPTPEAAEPDYRQHRRSELLTEGKGWILCGIALALFAYLSITNGIYRHWSTILVMLIDIVGLWLTYMLVQKSHGVHTRAADRVCGVLEAGGCDSVLSTSAASFFGLFGWSEVGFAYFGVSLIALITSPSSWPWLAACNVCCLPFTFWSIWYQKFRAKAWCTLCVSVQASLWLLFFCYFGGGWLKEGFPPATGFWLLGACYAGALLLINRILPHINFQKSNNPDKSDPADI